tara:strand:- start:2513 stop:2677 length:165 start_codon:yes stop_codon:yes gene_type:complete
MDDGQRCGPRGKSKQSETKKETLQEVRETHVHERKTLQFVVGRGYLQRARRVPT